MKKFKYLLCLLVTLIAITPFGVSAGGNSDDDSSSESGGTSHELTIPSFSFSPVEEYSQYYTCTYRLNLSEESPIFEGSFDFSITFNKKGGATDIRVWQASDMSDLTHLDSGGLSTTNNLGSKIYYTKSSATNGYYCPKLMAYLSEAPKDEYTTIPIQNFKIQEYDQSLYSSNPDKATVDIWYKLHEYKQANYSCRLRNEENCKNQKYCEWDLRGGFCYEKTAEEIEYDNLIEGEEPEEDTTRKEACTGYTEKIYNQTIEYSFSVDGVLTVTHGSGDLIGGFGGENWVDKESQLWNLWKKGGCCPYDNIGINYTADSNILSCDGSESIWDYESDNEDVENPDNGSYNEGELQSGCEIIPPVIRKWINNILNFVKYVALVLVIALGALDFIQASGTGEPDSIKKAGQKFVKRLIAVVVLFLVPVLVDFILNMINIYGVDPNNPTCL